MKTRAIWMPAALLLLVAVSARAQEAEKAPFEWKTSGDTVENYKAEFVMNAKLDQGSAEGVVNAYALLTDSRTAGGGKSREFYEGVNEIVKKASRPLAEKLAVEDVLKRQAEADKESEAKAKAANWQATATEIKGVTDRKDGAKLVETYQKTTYMNETWDYETGKGTGKMEEQVWENKFRYSCIKGEDGKWRIDGVESLQKNWEKMDDEGNAPEEWTATNHSLMWYLNYEAPDKPEDLKQDTPENAANSLFNCYFRSVETWQQKLYHAGQKGWLDTAKALMTEKCLKGAEDESTFKMEPKSREVDKVSDGKDGIKQVKFKASSEWSGAIEIHVQKVGEVWKIVNAGYYELKWNEMGDMMEGDFTTVNDLNSLTWR